MTTAAPAQVIDTSSDPAWRELTLELDAWATKGLTATLWWRDDDAVAPVDALHRLRRIAETGGVPVALAVVPAAVSPDLAAFLADWPGATVLQHGYNHVNYAEAGVKKTELAVGRPLEIMLAEIRKGSAILRDLFGPRALPVLVPPWNRISPGVVAALPKMGFTGLSAFKGRKLAPPGLVEINTHIDIMNWRGGGFVGERRALEDTVSQLRARRLATADPAEPTGLLTHHRVHDEAAWQFLARFLAATTAHPAVRWLDAATVFAVRS